MDPELLKRIFDIEKDLRDLTQEVYTNNFSAHQDFNKSSSFTTALKVPHYDVLPLICEQGQLCESGGKLKICSAMNTWTTVGTQS